MSKDTEKTKARKRLQVSNEKYRDNYERIFGKNKNKIKEEQK